VVDVVAFEVAKFIDSNLGPCFVLDHHSARHGQLYRDKPSVTVHFVHVLVTRNFPDFCPLLDSRSAVTEDIPHKRRSRQLMRRTRTGMYDLVTPVTARR